MYKVTIRLENGNEVQFVEQSILRAAVRVEEYHDNMLFCDIQQMEEGVSIGGGKVDQDNN